MHAGNRWYVGVNVSYLSRDRERVAVHKWHIVWDLEVRNLKARGGKRQSCFNLKWLQVQAVLCFISSYLAFAESSYLFCTGTLTLLQLDASTNLLAQPLIFHSNHLKAREGRVAVYTEHYSWLMRILRGCLLLTTTKIVYLSSIPTQRHYLVLICCPRVV